MGASDPSRSRSRMATTPTGAARQDEVDQLRERLEELRIKHEQFQKVTEVRQDMKQQMWRERLAFMSVIAILATALMAQLLGVLA